MESCNTLQTVIEDPLSNVFGSSSGQDVLEPVNLRFAVGGGYLSASIAIGLSGSVFSTQESVEGVNEDS